MQISEADAIERLVIAQEAQAQALESIEEILLQMLELKNEAEQGARKT